MGVPKHETSLNHPHDRLSVRPILHHYITTIVPAYTHAHNTSIWGCSLHATTPRPCLYSRHVFAKSCGFSLSAFPPSTCANSHLASLSDRTHPTGALANYPGSLTRLSSDETWTTRNKN